MAVDADRDRSRKRRRDRSRSRSRSASADARRKRSHRRSTRSRSRSAARGRKRSRSVSSSRSSGSSRSRDRGSSHRKRKSSKKSRREKDRKSSRSHRRRRGSLSSASRSRSPARSSRKDDRSSRRRSRSARRERSRSRTPKHRTRSSSAKKEAAEDARKTEGSRARAKESETSAAKEDKKSKDAAVVDVSNAASAAVAAPVPESSPADGASVAQKSDATLLKPAEVETTAEEKKAAAATSASSSSVDTASSDKRRGRSRSRERRRNGSRRSRSRSRSRGRDRDRDRGRTSTTTASSKPASTAAPKAVIPTTERAKTFKFSGIALKADGRAKSGGLKKAVKAVNPLTAQPFGQVPNDDDDEKKRRREKMKVWREQQLKLKEEEAAKFLAPVDAVPKQLPLLTPEHEAKKQTEEEKQQRERIQQVVQEVDPLDAYMAGLVDEAAIHNSLTNPASNVISLDEIESKQKIDIYGTFLPATDAQPAKKVEKTPAATPAQELPPKETPEEREAREERELKEFMKAIKAQREKEAGQPSASIKSVENGENGAGVDDAGTAKKTETGRIYQGFEEDIIGEDAAEVDQRSALEILQDAQKKKEIKPVDHSKMNYLPFQKKFYVVPKEIKDMTEEQVEAIRKELEIKIRGKNCPRPLQKWTQCGFSLRMLQLIQKHGYSEPFAIQRQALPAIMSGRDVIGIAKTGSGKTLAFLLPMFRHILHQPPLQDSEGPIGLILAPARELAQQIYLEAKRFAKGLGMRATAVYGGSSVSEQIANLKRGSDVVICTPGRMIDILCMSTGKMVSLQRVTYVVLDEADRMFDMGFEPQITKIMMNIRPDRQTLLFSATFPRAVESLARKVLKKPVEITVGARSTASGDITQYVEVREEGDKFMRLLQLLGLWYEKGNVLVFVNTQQACDKLFQDLMKAGYPALSLHGGKDQVDRDYTIDDFKRKVRTLMVATSVAGRGLDVKDLVLVINYHCPNHLEDYVHRVGRTGRAGRKGTAYTFISPDEEEYAVDLVKALESAKQSVPPELSALAEGFKEKVKRGEARYHGSGFKGKGFTFDETERNETQRVADLQKRQYEIDQGIYVEDGGAGADDDDGDDPSRDTNAAEGAAPSTAAGPASSSAAPPMDSVAMSAFIKAQKIIQNLDLMYKNGKDGGDADDHFTDELEINDYPQQARWKVTQKEASESVSELTGAAIIARGSFVPAGRKPNPGERKLYLAIEGPTRAAVLDAKRELQRILDETTLQVGLGGDKYGKYNL